ncbi:MAG: S8 family serine peptidase, partial [Verrucomicrobiota bacterium]
FPTAKVVGGWDFCGDDYDSTGQNGTPTLRPDADPLDPAASGHGTHVAGIAAGQGVLADGTAFAGPYGAGFDPARFLVGPGVAPEARLYALKIFGRQGRTSSSLIVSALERVADPNGDGNTADRLDVVNLSLGSPFGSDDVLDPEVQSIERLVRLGVVVVVAAGNSGNTLYKADSPGVAPRAITVANIHDPGFSTLAIRVDSPASVAGAYEAVEGSFTRPLRQTGEVRGQLVAGQPSGACSALQNTAAVNGRIVLLDRGTCFFVDKLRRAQEAGAIGVVMVNNVAGPPITMGGSGDTSDITIPGVMITLEDGARLRAALGSGVTVVLSDAVRRFRPELADTLNESSTRGPVWPSGRLKPDLAAPGSSIESAKAGSGTGSVEQTGTSMSAPHVAGAAALVRQARPGWSPEAVKAVLMNTARAGLREVAGGLYPESRVGAGRLDVAGALQSAAVAWNATEPGAVSLSLGALESSGFFTTNVPVAVVNLGTGTLEFTVSATNTLDHPGVRLVALPDRLRVAPGATGRVEMRWEVDPARLRSMPDPTSPAEERGRPRFQAPEAGGQVWFHPVAAGSQPQLHVPWHAVIRAVGRKEVAAAQAGVPAGADVLVPVATRGSGAHANPLVAVLQLGAQDSPAFNPGQESTDILAVGAATDALGQSRPAEATLYFGMALAGRWLTPQRKWSDYEIELDRNGDGLPDFVLVNASMGSLAATDWDGEGGWDLATDGWVAALRQGGSVPVDVAPWNVLPPSAGDTAPFLSGALLYSVRAADLGLTNSTSRLRYRGVTRGNGTDSTSWATLEIGRAVLDPAGGVNGTPVWPEGRAIRVRLNRANATQAGYSGVNPVPLLLLHFNNVSGQQWSLLKLRLDTPDVDQDGLADDWEMAALGDLDSAGAGDRDGDDFADRAEWVAGTDPLDPGSNLRLLTPVDGRAEVRWTSVAGRTYRLLRSTSLAGEYVVVRSGILATPGVNGVADPSLFEGPGPWFFRVAVE